MCSGSLTGSVRRRRFALALAQCFVLIAVVAPAALADTQPNVILILADDLGWTDLHCYGSDLHETPNIDRLARDGMRFTAAYSACTVCSPTRAALLTGKSPARLHITDWIPGYPRGNTKLLVPKFTLYLPAEEVTIADMMRAGGYATASIGKWHLGGPPYDPEHHGFDLNIAGSEAPQPRPGYFAPYGISKISQGPPGEYITDRLTTESIQFIRAHADKPFFLYLPHFAVHTPIQAKDDLTRRYEAKIRQGMNHHNAVYAAMIDSLDQSVGRICETVRELRIADRTIMIFTSDNGGRVPITSNAPLRAGKGSCYEGGVRVPLIVDWPGVTASNSTCETPVITMDLLPTIINMCHLSLNAEAICDGASLLPLLRQTAKLPDRALFWHYPHYHPGGAMPYGAIRSADMKLVEFYEDHRVELYNLRDDIGEQRDLSRSKPDVAASLRVKLHVWTGAVGAQLPTDNKEFLSVGARH